jgi:hypothetical protein
MSAVLPIPEVSLHRNKCREGPRLCEKVRARERRRIVFSIVFSRLLSSALSVFQIDDVEMKFLSANSISEFSHGLGHQRTLAWQKKEVASPLPRPLQEATCTGASPSLPRIGLAP